VTGPNVDQIAGSNKSAGLKREGMKKKLMAAHVSYKNGEAGSADHLLGLVRQFAYLKVYHLEFDFKGFGSVETADDWAQEIVIKVWRGLDERERSSESFYAWVHKIAFNQATDAFNELHDARQEKVSLTVPVTLDGSDENEEEENPEIYRASKGYEGLNVQIPPSVQGIELNICKLLMDGKSYIGAAKSLNMSVSAVSKRMSRLKDRLKAERECR
jgi:RNA polymerase sigma factor (sigma-70 family)